ncbi:uncharacterized [Tachysurus ichikawai]
MKRQRCQIGADKWRAARAGRTSHLERSDDRFLDREPAFISTLIQHALEPRVQPLSVDLLGVRGAFLNMASEQLASLTRVCLKFSRRLQRRRRARPVSDGG